MTSSEDNRVSIPPQMSAIGLTDHRNCDSYHQLPFHSVDFLLVSAGNWHRYTFSSTQCQFYYSAVQVLWPLQQLESMFNLG